MQTDTDTRSAVAEMFANAKAGAGPVQDAPESTGEASAAPETTHAAAPERAPAATVRDEKGRFAAEKPGAASKGNEAPSATGSGAQEGGSEAEGASEPAGAAPSVEPTAPVLPDLKPPQDWRPIAREKWAALPREVQEEAIRLHLETRKTLQESADARKGWQTYQEVVRPYEAQIRQAGVQPDQYIGDLLRTAHALTYSPPHQQADILADIVLRFGAHLLKPDGTDADGTPSVPLNRALIARMQGQTAPQTQQPQNVQAIVDQAMQRREQAAVQTRTQQETDQFAKTHEFCEQLAPAMAGLLRGGVAKDLADAYEKASALDPQVSKVLKQREEAKAANARRASTTAAAAASGVKNEPAGPSSGTDAAKDTREEVARQFRKARQARV